MTCENEIKQALKQDFNDLYVPQYRTDYESARLLRSVEIDIMHLKHLLKAVNNDIQTDIGRKLKVRTGLRRINANWNYYICTNWTSSNNIIIHIVSLHSRAATWQMANDTR